MGELVTMAADIQKKQARAAWRHYMTLLEKQTGSAKEAEELLGAGRAVGRSAAEIEADQAWLTTYRSQLEVISNGSGLRDQEIALEQKIQEMEREIQAAIAELRKPQNAVKEELGLLQGRANAAHWAKISRRDLEAQRPDLTRIVKELNQA